MFRAFGINWHRCHACKTDDVFWCVLYWKYFILDIFVAGDIIADRGMIIAVWILLCLMLIVFLNKQTTDLVVFKVARSKRCNALQRLLTREKLDEFDSVYIIDIIDSPKIREQFSITTIPTSIIIQGKYETEIARIEGYSKRTYIEWLKENGKRRS